MHVMTKQGSIDLSDSFEKIPFSIFTDALAGLKTCGRHNSPIDQG